MVKAAPAAPIVTGAAPAASRTDIEAKVNEQYDTGASMAFYEFVMGGGGDDIHYGIFNSDKDDLKTSSHNSILQLAAMAESCGALRKDGDNKAVRVLDLGSGKGGAARFLATTYGCHVTCFNLGASQNDFNKKRAIEAGIGELISTHVGSFNEPLPADWTDSFDLVWSQEAFCHAIDHGVLIGEVQRILKPGGTVVFSDIMQGDNGGDCTSFTGQNVTAKLASPTLYKEEIARSGMRLVAHKDLTHHLTPYFRCMLDAVKESKLPLQLRGVSLSRLEAYEQDLVTRFEAVRQRAFAWGMFSAQNLLSSDALLNGATGEGPTCAVELEKCLNAQYDSEASMNFYKFTMGGGTDHVHYGVFKTPQDTLSDATHNTVLVLAELARRISPLGLGQGSHVRVLDLGSGKGGAARYLAERYGCHVTCFNLGANQNAYNAAAARAAGIEHLVACHQGNFNSGLPAEWTSSFDLVWSQEALCHARDQVHVLAEVQRVLKPGGAAVFTDIMRASMVADDDSDLSPEGDAMSRVASSAALSRGAPSRTASFATDLDAAVTGGLAGVAEDSPEGCGAERSSAIPIPGAAAGGAVGGGSGSGGLRTSGAGTAGVAAPSPGSYGTSLLSSAPRDFSLSRHGGGGGSGAKRRASGRTARHSTPGLYMASIAAAALELVDFRDLTENLQPFYAAIIDEVEKNEAALERAGVPRGRVTATVVDLQHRVAAVRSGALVWGAFTVRKPANARTLVVGGGPLGTFTATRLSQSGVANVVLKVLPATPAGVLVMARLAGVAVVDDWEDVAHTHWGTVLVAVKTHWLPQIAMEMACSEVTFDNVCLAYNGYTQTPEYFTGRGSCRAVVPQSFSFDEAAPLAWDICHGNAHNPWTLPQGKCAAAIAGQLAQAGVASRCDPAFHRSAFFKFCVNNAANLLSVIEEKCCRELVDDARTYTLMEDILTETFDVLELDPFYVALVPMHRREFIRGVLKDAPGSVASYCGHRPSSYQHYTAKKLVDTRALNGFVVRKARALNTSAHLNEYITRRVVAISDATVHGTLRGEWEARVALSAAKRLIEREGMGTSVWGHASARHPSAPDRMLLAPFGEGFGHARASSLRALPMHPAQLTDDERRGANVTAIVLHGAVYAARPDAQCVLHTHSPYATALAAARDAPFDAEAIQDAMQFLGRVAVHGFGGVADDAEEMAAVGAAAADADVLFLSNHGVIVLGEDVATAFSRLWYLERCCRTQLLVMGAGKEVHPAGEVGVKHTVDWYQESGVESAHFEWLAHLKDLFHAECCEARTKPFWYE